LAESVQLTPVLFQRYVPAVCDLRVTVIGERLFAAAARAEQYDADIRFNVDAKYQAHDLPAGVQGKLFGLMRRLGLEYGAADFRLTPEGEYVFLEVNPAGQFLYIEKATEQPIAAALAEHLARGVAASSQDDGRWRRRGWQPEEGGPFSGFRGGAVAALIPAGISFCPSLPRSHPSASAWLSSC
jgi:hypothetical protein